MKKSTKFIVLSILLCGVLGVFLPLNAFADSRKAALQILEDNRSAKDLMNEVPKLRVFRAALIDVLKASLGGSSPSLNSEELRELRSLVNETFKGRKRDEFGKVFTGSLEAITQIEGSQGECQKQPQLQQEVSKEISGTLQVLSRQFQKEYVVNCHQELGSRILRIQECEGLSGREGVLLRPAVKQVTRGRDGSEIPVQGVYAWDFKGTPAEIKAYRDKPLPLRTSAVSIPEIYGEGANKSFKEPFVLGFQSLKDGIPAALGELTQGNLQKVLGMRSDLSTSYLTSGGFNHVFRVHHHDPLEELRKFNYGKKQNGILVEENSGLKDLYLFRFGKNLTDDPEEGRNQLIADHQKKILVQKYRKDLKADPVLRGHLDAPFSFNDPREEALARRLYQLSTGKNPNEDLKLDPKDLYSSVYYHHHPDPFPLVLKVRAENNLGNPLSLEQVGEALRTDLALQDVLEQAVEVRNKAMGGSPLFRVEPILYNRKTLLNQVTFQKAVDGPTVAELYHLRAKALVPRESELAINKIKELGFDNIGDLEKKLTEVEAFYKDTHGDVINYRRDNHLTEVQNDGKNVGFDANHGKNAIWDKSRKQIVFVDW